MIDLKLIVAIGVLVGGILMGDVGDAGPAPPPPPHPTISAPAM
jgi:hypothetical protein